MLLLGEAVADLDAGRKKYDEQIQSGAGAKKFQEIVARQGGDPAIVDDPAKLPQAKEQVEFAAGESGYIVQIETERVGRAAMALGAGRAKVEDSIDPAVGLVLHKKLGDIVEQGETLATLHVNRSETLQEAQGWLEPAFQFGSSPPERVPLVRETIE
jgi:thymidine phosphorylase